MAALTGSGLQMYGSRDTHALLLNARDKTVVKRWQTLTGKTVDGDGRSFAEIKLERAGVPA